MKCIPYPCEHGVAMTFVDVFAVARDEGNGVVGWRKARLRCSLPSVTYLLYRIRMTCFAANGAVIMRICGQLHWKVPLMSLLNCSFWRVDYCNVSAVQINRPHPLRSVHRTLVTSDSSSRGPWTASLLTIEKPHTGWYLMTNPHHHSIFGYMSRASQLIWGAVHSLEGPARAPQPPGKGERLKISFGEFFILKTSFLR